MKKNRDSYIVNSILIITFNKLIRNKKLLFFDKNILTIGIRYIIILVEENDI